MKESTLIAELNDLKRRLNIGNMALQQFMNESTMHMNVLTMGFNAMKNLIVEKEVMTSKEIDDKIIEMTEKMREQANSKIDTETDEEDPTTKESSEDIAQGIVDDVFGAANI